MACRPPTHPLPPVPPLPGHRPDLNRNPSRPPSPLTAAFFGVHEIEEGDEVSAMSQAGLRALDLEARSGGVPPPTFHHEAVEQLNLFVLGLSTVSEAPVEDLGIGAAFQRAGGEGLIAHSEELADAVIKGALARDHAHMITSGQFTLGLVADFVDDTTKDHDTFYGIARGTEGKRHAGTLNVERPTCNFERSTLEVGSSSRVFLVQQAPDEEHHDGPCGGDGEAAEVEAIQVLLAKKFLPESATDDAATDANENGDEEARWIFARVKELTERARDEADDCPREQSHNR